MWDLQLTRVEQVGMHVARTFTSHNDITISLSNAGCIFRTWKDTP